MRAGGRGTPDDTPDETAVLVAAVFREERGRLLAGLVRRFGDLDLAEDVTSEAIEVALARWPVDGVPPKPGAWLMTTARRRAVDRLRRNQAFAARIGILQVEAQRFDTVHDVAAHLTLATRTTLPVAIKAAIRARGNFNRMTADPARERAGRFDRAALTAQLRQTAGSNRRAPGAGPMDLLVDVLVHGQDIARPLGRTRPMPVEPTLRAVQYARHSRLYGAQRRFGGTRLVAADCEWFAGEGPHEVHGPVGDLLTVATGRTAGLESLTGPGLDRVAARL